MCFINKRKVECKCNEGFIWKLTGVFQFASQDYFDLLCILGLFPDPCKIIFYVWMGIKCQVLPSLHLPPRHLLTFSQRCVSLTLVLPYLCSCPVLLWHQQPLLRLHKHTHTPCVLLPGSTLLCHIQHPAAWLFSSLELNFEPRSAPDPPLHRQAWYSVPSFLWTSLPTPSLTEIDFKKFMEIELKYKFILVQNNLKSLHWRQMCVILKSMHGFQLHLVSLFLWLFVLSLT